MSGPLATATTNTRLGSMHRVTAATRYTKSYDTTGWLKVQLEADAVTGKRTDFAFICEFVKVIMAGEKGDRAFFVIKEGEHKGRTASMKKENAAKCLVDVKRGSGAKLVATMGTYKELASKPRRGQIHNQLVSTLEFDGHSAMITLDSDIPYVETNRVSRSSISSAIPSLCRAGSTGLWHRSPLRPTNTPPSTLPPPAATLI
ncbi:MAG: hypothetical protein RSD99_01525 [Janthinobacterium sp.]